jgi:hypothetical protein
MATKASEGKIASVLVASGTHYLLKMHRGSPYISCLLLQKIISRLFLRQVKSGQALLPFTAIFGTNADQQFVFGTEE